MKAIEFQPFRTLVPKYFFDSKNPKHSLLPSFLVGFKFCTFWVILEEEEEKVQKSVKNGTTTQQTQKEQLHREYPRH